MTLCIDNLEIAKQILFLRKLRNQLGTATAIAKQILMLWPVVTSLQGTGQTCKQCDGDLESGMSSVP
jgi:hypothetical protein